MTLIPRRWPAPFGAAVLALSIPLVATAPAGAAVQWSPAVAVPGSGGVTDYAVAVDDGGPAAIALEAHGPGGTGDGVIRLATGC